MPEPSFADKLREMARRTQEALNRSKVGQEAEKLYRKGTDDLLPTSLGIKAEETKMGEASKAFAEAHPRVKAAILSITAKMAPHPVGVQESGPTGYALPPQKFAEWAVKSVPDPSPTGERTAMELPEEPPLTQLEQNAASRQAAQDSINQTLFYRDTEAMRRKVAQGK